MNIDAIIENAQLKGRIIALDAQVETLTAEVRCLEAVIRSHERVDCLSVTSLKKQLVEADAQVERLTKAGDAMANNIPYYADVDISAETLREFTEKWHSAKEGKQS
jgi:hypothetical protein